MLFNFCLSLKLEKPLITIKHYFRNYFILPNCIILVTLAFNWHCYWHIYYIVNEHSLLIHIVNTIIYTILQQLIFYYVQFFHNLKRQVKQIAMRWSIYVLNNCCNIKCQNHTLLGWKSNSFSEDSNVRVSPNFVIFATNWSDTIRQPLFSTLLYRFQLSVNNKQHYMAKCGLYISVLLKLTLQTFIKYTH